MQGLPIVGSPYAAALRCTALQLALGTRKILDHWVHRIMRNTDAAIQRAIMTAYFVLVLQVVV